VAVYFFFDVFFFAGLRAAFFTTRFLAGFFGAAFLRGALFTAGFGAGAGAGAGGTSTAGVGSGAGFSGSGPKCPQMSIIASFSIFGTALTMSDAGLPQSQRF
jgi:hypothetical protein